MGWLYLLNLRASRLHDTRYEITALIQRNKQSDPLKTAYLAEWLGLSIDRPVNLYRFDVAHAAKTLVSTSLIHHASLKKIAPNTLLVDYQMRTPIAYVGDLSNTAIDEEGVLFPVHPFFTPKHLPVLYLGEDVSGCQWGRCMSERPPFCFAQTLLKHFYTLQLENLTIRQIDTARLQASQYGRREVVLVLEQRKGPLLFIRLTPQSAMVALNKLPLLLPLCRQAASDSAGIAVDLRLFPMVFLRRSF